MTPRRIGLTGLDTSYVSASTNFCGGLANITNHEFVEGYLSGISPSIRLRAHDFLKGCTHSEAIEAAIASAQKSKLPFSIVVLDTLDWLIDRAILLPSNMELIIDGCRLKLADNVFDNIIRVAGLIPNREAPNDTCDLVSTTVNIKITGRNGAVIEGPDRPYEAENPRTGVVEKWVGDFFGWRTVGILLSATERYELSGFAMQKTHCWAISQDKCMYGYLHDITFNTEVKNGDGINFRNGCSNCLVENISGTTSDDSVACTALDSTVIASNSNYIYPMQPMGWDCIGNGNADIHDIVIRNIRTGGRHHGVICLTTSPSVYNIKIENVLEEGASSREAAVKIYTGYGSGYRKGNLRNIVVSNVISRGARYAVMVKGAVKDVHFFNVKQFNPKGALHLFEGDSEHLQISENPEG
jgi:hypothetical protein